MRKATTWEEIGKDVQDKLRRGFRVRQWGFGHGSGDFFAPQPKEMTDHLEFLIIEPSWSAREPTHNDAH